MRSSIKKSIFLLAAISLASTPALAQTANFDDLTPFTPVPPDYALAGSIWNNIFVFDQAFLSANYPGKEACAVSHPNCVYNNVIGFNPTLSGISRTSPFDFTGGYFLSFGDQNCTDYSACAIALTVTGYNSGSVVASSTVGLDPYVTQWFAFNFSNVDNVTFDPQSYIGDAQAFYLADNLVFNQNTSTVPEPASMTLLGTGLVGLYSVARRRRNNAA